MAPFLILKASDYQDPDDDARKAAEAADAGVAAQIQAGFDRWRTEIDVAALAALLGSGVTVQVWDLLRIDQVSALMQPAVNRLTELYDAVADQTELPPDAGVYNPLDEAVLAEQQQAAAALVTTITDSAKAVADQVISDGLTASVPADEIAANVLATVGMTSRQAKAVANFRALLERGDAGAMQRALRDRRFDSTVARLIRDKEFAAEADLARIDRMVQRYAEKAIRYRATMLAQYQTMQAANAGRLAAWSQYADRKRLDPSSVRRFWQTAADERVCPVCRAIPILNPEGVPLGEKYVTPDGETTSPPEHGSCRCTERFEVDKGASQQSEPVPYGELRIAQ